MLYVKHHQTGERMKKRNIGMLLACLLVLGLQPQVTHAQISLDVGGYMQNWFIAHEENELIDQNGELYSTSVQGFRVRRARMVARGTISDQFSATTWIEFAGTTPSLLDFHVDAHLRPWFNVRAGQFIMPGQSHDTARLVSSRLIFYERSPVTTRLATVMGYSAFRDVGMMVYGQHGRVWYGVHAGNGAGRFNHAGTSITERQSGGGLYGARVDVSLTDTWTVGSHISTNQQRDVVQSGSDPFDIDRTSWSVRTATNNALIPGLFSQFEYMSLNGSESSRGIRTDASGEYTMHGFYAELGYRITREWHLLGRYDELIEKPGQGTADVDRSTVNNITLGISRFIYQENTELARLHLNYSFGSSGPMDLDNSILVLVFQLRFIP